MKLSQLTNVSMLVISPVILGFGAAMILVTDSTPFGIFNLSVFFVFLPFGLAFIVPSVSFCCVDASGFSADEIRGWRKTGQFKLFA